MFKKKAREAEQALLSFTRSTNRPVGVGGAVLGDSPVNGTPVKPVEGSSDSSATPLSLHSFRGLSGSGRKVNHSGGGESDGNDSSDAPLFEVDINPKAAKGAKLDVGKPNGWTKGSFAVILSRRVRRRVLLYIPV